MDAIRINITFFRYPVSILLAACADCVCIFNSSALIYEKSFSPKPAEQPVVQLSFPVLRLNIVSIVYNACVTPDYGVNIDEPWEIELDDVVTVQSANLPEKVSQVAEP